MIVKLSSNAHVEPPLFSSVKVSALPDTGANKSIIAKRVLDSLFIKYERDDSYEIEMANPTTLDCQGTVKLFVYYQGVSTPIHALVATNLRQDFLISWNDLRNMRVISHDFPDILPEKSFPSVATISSKPKTDDTFEGLIQEFTDVFDESEITPMTGAPMSIHIRKSDPEYKPLRMKTARRTPQHFKKEADLLIDQLLASGVIVPVDTNERIEWCSPGFFVPKPNGKVRLVTDYRQINKFIDRPVHPFPSCRDIIRGIKPDSNWFLKFDAVQGYFQIPLDEESSKLTTFLVERGRFRFTRAPMGLNPSSDYFCERSDLAFAAVTDLLKIVDDGLLQAPTQKDLLISFRQILECCRKSNLTLSRPKLRMGQSVSFAGYELTKDGVKPDNKRTDAIRKFPAPTNITELRSFLGLVNQLGMFIPDLAHVTTDLRGLLKKNVAYTWLPEHQKSFEETKRLLVSDLLIKPFKSDLETELLTDASRLHGLGYALIQRSPDQTNLSLVQCGSRSLIDAETRYSTTELECLAIYYAVKDCEYYLQGVPFKVVTDHKPLVGTFVKHLHEIENARLLRYREKLAHYSFTVSYVPGKTHLIADALSRAPVFAPSETDVISVNASLVKQLSTSDPALSSFKTAAAADSQYTAVVNFLVSGIDPKDFPPNHPAQAFRSLWSDLSVLDNVLLVLDDSRLVVPKACRADVLANLHKSHSGITKTRQLAKNLYFWPGMSTSIAHMINDCGDCQRFRASNHEIPFQHPQSDEPMHSIGLDLFECAGKHYLCMVDRFSYYIWVKLLHSLTTTAIVKILDIWFLEYGYPAVIISDNGPQFRTEFQDFCKSKHINHLTSSPYNPRSNGLAESAVKQAKLLLQKSKSTSEFDLALVAWQNTPSANDTLSPAQKFYNRRPRNPLFPSYSKLSSPVPPRGTERTRLPALSLGDKVRLQNPLTKRWETEGVISAINPSGHSYDILMPDGDIFTRGRRLLKKILPSPLSVTDTPSSDEPVAQTPPVAAPPQADRPLPRRPRRRSDRKTKRPDRYPA